jgi:hypothetical protein
MQTSGVRIHRWQNEYLVARDHGAPEQTRSELDRIAQTLPAELCAGLEGWASARGDPVVLVKRVVVDCELDTSRAAEHLVARWAERFARALIRAVDTEADGVVCFPTQAAFRAQFVTDLASGRAWQLWYYRMFEGLCALPASAAIRTLLLENATLGRATLVELPAHAWHRLACCLSESDCLRVVHGLCDDGGSIDADALARLLRASDEDLRALAPWFVRALQIFASAIGRGLAPTHDLAAFVRIAARLSSLPSDAGAVGELIALDPDHDSDTWTALATTHVWGPVLAAYVRGTSARASVSEDVQDSVTSFGGLALLLREMDGLLDDAVSGTLRPAAIAEPRSLVAWLALAQCAGSGLASTFLAESFWRQFFGISPRVSSDRIVEWLEGARADDALSALARVADRMRRGESVVTTLRTGSCRRAVAVDTATRLWLRFDDVARESGATATRWRDRVSAARLARADWRYLSAPYALPSNWQIAITQLAQIAMRRLAYRIPGFAGASLLYLHSNFLAGAGRVNLASGRLTLPRPPLHTLLHLTGMARSEIAWTGPPARVLRPEYVP